MKKILVLAATLLVAQADHFEIPEDYKDGDFLPDGFFDEHEAGKEVDETKVPDDDAVDVSNITGEYNTDEIQYTGNELDLIKDVQNPDEMDNKFMSLLLDVNQCFVNIVQKYNISEEIKGMSETVGNKEYLQRLEAGNSTEVREQISEAITPIFQKLMNASGEDIVKHLPGELIDWFKDTTIVIVKHGGQVEGYQFSMYPGLEEEPKVVNVTLNETNQSDTHHQECNYTCNCTNQTKKEEEITVPEPVVEEPKRNLTLDELLEQIQALVPNATIDRSNFSINITLIEQNFTAEPEEAHDNATSFGMDLDDHDDEKKEEDCDSEKKDDSKSGNKYYNGYLTVKSYARAYVYKYYYNGYSSTTFYTPGSKYNYYSYTYSPYSYTYSGYYYKAPKTTYGYSYDYYSYYYSPKDYYSYYDGYSSKYYYKKKYRGKKWKKELQDFVDDVKDFIGKH